MDGLPDDRSPGKNRPLGEMGTHDADPPPTTRPEQGNREDRPGSGQGA